MTRYTRGYTMSDCGPVAALNILKWAGMKVTYKDHIKHLKKACKFINDDEFAGVRWWNIRKALSKIGNGVLSVKAYHVTNIDILRRHVSRGGAFILRHRTAPRTPKNPPGHYHYSVVVPDLDTKSFVWLNYTDKQCVISPDVFEASVMKNAQFGDVPIALLIRKI